MLTPNEIRERLERVQRTMRPGGRVEDTLKQLVPLLDILPELAALASGRSVEDAGRRYRDEPAPCPDCGDTEPCERARNLEGQ